VDLHADEQRVAHDLDDLGQVAVRACAQENLPTFF
jgi:hypothetical protein